MKHSHSRGDVSAAEDVKEMVRAAVDSYGKLNILVGTAGINWEEKSTVELKEEVFVKTMAIKAKGVWLGMKYAIPEMLKSDNGSII